MTTTINQTLNPLQKEINIGRSIRLYSGDCRLLCDLYADYD